MIILGVNAYHADSSACLVVDGKLIAAVEEERFSRIKHWAGFPVQAITYCLNEGGVSLSDVDHVAINSDPKANLFKKIGYTFRNVPDLRMILDRIKNKRERVNIREELELAFPTDDFSGTIHHIEHHLSHLASAHFVSPFENSVAISVDGFGDFSSTAWGDCYGEKIEVNQRVFFPHSLGVFYQALTQFLGFPNYGDEYKVMGLAPYGKKFYMTQLEKIISTNIDGTFLLNLDFFRHHNEKIEYEWSGGSPFVGELFNKKAMEELFGFAAREKDSLLEDRHYNLAHSIQAMYEKVFFNIIEVAYSQSELDCLTLAGGCAMNSVANGKIYRQSPFKKVYVQSAAGDAGGAIGAAFVVANKMGETKKRFYMDHAYWGPAFDDEYNKSILIERK